MNQTEFLVDFLKYYTANPIERRNIDGKKMVCKYESLRPQSAGCGVGRHLIGTDEQKRKWDNCSLNSIRGVIQILSGSYNDGSPVIEERDKIDDIRPEWMKLFPTDFLKEMQELHDYDSGWHDDKLSDVGKFRIGDMVIKWGIPKEAVAEWVEDEFIPPFHK
jgi:hypothetical protein